jgi:hypothetical protein
MSELLNSYCGNSFSIMQQPIAFILCGFQVGSFVTVCGDGF